MDSAPASSRRTAATAGAAVVLALAGSVAAIWYDRPGTAMFAGSVSAALAIGAMAVVGAIVIFAAPGNRVGWLMLAAAAVTGAGAGLNDAGLHGVITGSVPGAGYLAAVGPGLRAAGMLIAVVAVPAVFPDGKLPGPRWRWLGWSTVTAVTCLFLGNVLSPSAQQAGLAHWRSPLGLPGRYGTIVNALTAAGVLLAVVSAGGAVAGLVSRWRRGGARVRQQLLFLALAACPPAFLLVAIIVANGVPSWLFGVVLLPLPAAIAVAILSHGLYDLRRAAHQGLLWLAMSGTVAGIYVTDVRRVVEGLRPPALDELGLAGACTQAVDRLTGAAGVAARVEVSGELPALPAAAEVAAYRIVVEAVTNVVRHARARCCRVTLAWSPAGLSIAVTDDGTGLPAANRQGNGLAIMRERAEELGGTLTITDAAPGVSVQARLPAAVAAAAAQPAVTAPAVTASAVAAPAVAAPAVAAPAVAAPAVPAPASASVPAGPA